MASDQANKETTKEQAATKPVSALQLTSSQADVVFSLSNLVLIIGAALVAVGTVGSIWSAGLREEFAKSKADADLAAANAAAQAAADRAKEANEKAEAEHVARVKIEARMAPRSLTNIITLVGSLKPYAGNDVLILYPTEHEPESLAWTYPVS